MTNGSLYKTRFLSGAAPAPTPTPFSSRSLPRQPSCRPRPPLLSVRVPPPGAAVRGCSLGGRSPPGGPGRADRGADSRPHTRTPSWLNGDAVFFTLSSCPGLLFCVLFCFFFVFFVASSSLSLSVVVFESWRFKFVFPYPRSHPEVALPAVVFPADARGVSPRRCHRGREIHDALSARYRSSGPDPGRPLSWPFVVRGCVPGGRGSPCSPGCTRESSL